MRLCLSNGMHGRCVTIRFRSPCANVAVPGCDKSEKGLVMQVFRSVCSLCGRLRSAVVPQQTKRYRRPPIVTAVYTYTFQGGYGYFKLDLGRKEADLAATVAYESVLKARESVLQAERFQISQVRCPLLLN